MPTPPTPSPAASSHRPRWHWLAVVLLLATHYVLALSALAHKSVTSDEIAHQTAGLCYWRFNDYRHQPENGQLPQRLAALPLILGNYDWDKLLTKDDLAKYDIWHLGERLYYKVGLPLDRILLQGRAVMACISVLLGLCVYLWSRKLFGPFGGLLSLFLYTFSPTMLAHGPLMTSDATLALTMLATTGVLWLLLHRITAWRLAGAGLLMGALALSKMSAPLILPIAAILLAVKLIRGLPLTLGRRTIRGRWPQAALLAGAGLAVTVITVFIIWGSFGFRYSLFNGPGQSDAIWEKALAKNDAPARLLTRLRDHHLLPEAYLYGYAHVFSHEHRQAFLNGKYSIAGWRMFFPYAFLVKTPLETQLVVLLALLAAVLGWRAAAARLGRVPWEQIGLSLYEATPLLAIIAVVGLVAIMGPLNIGHRHILALYPPMFILAGGAAVWLRSGPKVLGGLVVAAAVVLVIDAMLIYPNFLAYFNPIAGGPTNGYRHLVDSSLDWGQDLPGLATWLDRHNCNRPDAAYISYFGNGSPSYYHIQAARLPGFPDASDVDPWPWHAGVYCISATLLQSVDIGHYPGNWCVPWEAQYQQFRQLVRPWVLADSEQARQALLAERGADYWRNTIIEFNMLRLARLTAYLRTREPDDNVGHSILIYRLTDDDVLQALAGPPAERYSDMTIDLGPDEP